MSEQKVLQKCPYLKCSFSSFTRPSYNQHKSVHIGDTGLKVSKCRFMNCNKIFMLPDDYIKHMQSIHNVMQSRKPVFEMITA